MATAKCKRRKLNPCSPPVFRCPAKRCKEISRVQPTRKARSPAPSGRLRESKASRPAGTGLLAKTISVCPWRRPSRHTGETKRLKLECLSRAPCRASSPAEPMTTADAVEIGSLSLNRKLRMRANHECFVGAARVAPSRPVREAPYRSRNGIKMVR